MTTQPNLVAPAAPVDSSAPLPPKKSSGFLKNWKMLAGVVVLLVLVIGGAAAFVLQQQSQDVRQQAMEVEPGGGGSGDGVCGGIIVQNGVEKTCDPTQLTSGLACIYNCKCGFLEGSCAQKVAGEQCYVNAQCKSGSCLGGVPGTSGRAGVCASNPDASGATACPNGWEQNPDNLSCNTVQYKDSQQNSGNTCWRCVEYPRIEAGKTCTNDKGCICGSGADVGLHKENGEKCAQDDSNPVMRDCYKLTACEKISVSTSMDCPSSYPFDSKVSGIPAICSAPTNELICCRTNRNNVQAIGQKSCTDAGGSVISTDLCSEMNQCIIELGSQGLYDSSKRTCEGSPFNQWSDTDCACRSNGTSSNGQTGPCCVNGEYKSLCAATDPGVKKEPWKGESGKVCCKAVSGEYIITSKERCLGSEEGSVVSNASCTVVYHPKNAQDCSSGASAGGTGSTASGEMCVNPPFSPVKKYVKFTCPNGCVYDTDAQGVQAWRCYENMQQSDTPLSLGADECGQVDEFSGLNPDGTADWNSYCGYKPENYNCDLPKCQGGGSTPTPTPPVGPMCLNITVSPTAPTAGQSVTFTCGQVSGNNITYQFRVKTPAGSVVTVPALNATANRSQSYLVSESGQYTAQCRICVNSNCQEWENLTPTPAQNTENAKSADRAQCPCYDGYDVNGVSIPLADTYCGLEVCGRDKIMYTCTDKGWRSDSKRKCSSSDFQSTTNSGQKPNDPNPLPAQTDSAEKTSVPNSVMSTINSWLGR